MERRLPLALALALSLTGCTSLHVVDARSTEVPRVTAILIGHPGEQQPRVLGERLEAGCDAALRQNKIERAPKPPFMSPGGGENYYQALARNSPADSFLVLQFSYTAYAPPWISTVLATLVSARTGAILRRAVLHTEDPRDGRRLGEEACAAVVGRRP